MLAFSGKDPLAENFFVLLLTRTNRSIGDGIASASGAPVSAPSRFLCDAFFRSLGDDTPVGQLSARPRHKGNDEIG